MTCEPDSDLQEDQDLISRLLITAHRVMPEHDVVNAMRVVLADMQAKTVNRADDNTPTSEKIKP